MKASVRGIEFSYGGNLIAYTTDKMMGQESEVKVLDLRSQDGKYFTFLFKFYHLYN